MKKAKGKTKEFDAAQKVDRRRETKSKRKNRLRYSKLKPGNNPKNSKVEKHEEIQPQDLPQYTEAQKLEALSSTASLIMQSPETSLKLLKDLFVLLQDDSTTVILETLRKLCDVFLDILPTYKIRVESTSDEKEEVKLSKEVQELHDYESALLENYAKYLRITQAFLKMKSKKVKAKSVVRQIKETAVECLCRLLENAPHMNYTKSIMLLIVSKLASSNQVMRDRSMEAVRDLLSNLEHSASMLELKLQTVKAIGKLVKSRSHKLFDRKALAIFQEHRLIVNKGEAQAKMNPKIEELRLAIKKKKGKGKKKEARDLEKALLKELKETSAMTADASQLNKYNTEILREILAIYLSILKDYPKSPLMASVFEGLPYFAPYIDVEIVSDCLSVIKTYLKSTFVAEEIDLVNLTTALTCALKMAHTLGSTFDVDERSFLSYAFKLLDYFISRTAEMTQEEIFNTFIMGSLRLLFLEKKQLSMDVVAAFCKKLAAVTLHVPPANCVKMLQVLSEIFKKYPRMRSLLDWDESSVEPQIFVDKIIDPQYCVSASTVSIAKELAAIKEKFGKNDSEINATIKEIMSTK